MGKGSRPILMEPSTRAGSTKVCNMVKVNWKREEQSTREISCMITKMVMERKRSKVRTTSVNGRKTEGMVRVCGQVAEVSMKESGQKILRKV